MGFMSKSGVRFIQDKPKHRSALENLRALKEGGAIVLMTDMKHSPEDGVWTEFFGHKVLSFSGGAVLAKRAGVPIVPMVTYKEGGAYTIEFFPPILPRRTKSPPNSSKPTRACSSKKFASGPSSGGGFMTGLGAPFPSRPLRLSKDPCRSRRGCSFTVGFLFTGSCTGRFVSGSWTSLEGRGT